MAAVSHESVIYDVHDAKVYPLLTDVSGSAPTYGPAVDVPGIAEVEVEPNFATAELKGDAQVMAKKGKVDRINFTATYGKLAMDALKVMLGGTIEDTDGISADWFLTGDTSLPYFKLEFAIEDLDLGLGSLHVVLYKCNMTGGTLITGSTDEFGQPELELEAIPCQGTLPAIVGPPAIAAKPHPLIRTSLYAARTPLSS